MNDDIRHELAVLRAGNTPWHIIAEHMRRTRGIDKSAESWRKTLNRNGAQTPPVTVDTDEVRGKETITWKQDGSVEVERIIKLDPAEKENPRSVLLAHGYDPAAWELIYAKHSKWDTNLKAGDCRVFYASKITVRPKTVPDIDDVLRILETVVPKWIPTPPKFERQSELVLEMTLADLHLNKLAWAGTTGNDYDLKIACDRVRMVMADILQRMDGKKYKRIIVPVGNDMFNSDNSEGTTHKGTPQDNDTRLPKVFETAVALFAGIIEKFREYTDDVYVVLVPGNHDKDASMYFAHAMKAYFRNCPDVTVDTSARPRKYIIIGRCLLVLGHFDKETKTLAELIPSEGRRKWGQVDYVEVHGSHLHRESYRTYAGFELRRASSITGRDEYHTEEGYDSPVVHMTYVWDPETGIYSIWYSRIVGTKAQW